jgi:Ca2+-binding EF-hand superfamily protein
MSANPRLFFSKEMYDEIQETFKMLDEDNTGVINSRQLHLGLKCFGVTENKPLLTKALADVSEFVDFDEFTSIMVQLLQHPQWAYHEMQEAFHIFDKDKNGFLDPVEMKRVFSKLGEIITDTEVEDQLKEHDIDGDCHLVMAEFMKMVLSHQRTTNNR